MSSDLPGEGMGLADDYRRQLGWRDWDTALGALPSLEGRTVLDLGCAVGDQSALLAQRGAKVLGIDGNADLLKVARRRSIAGAEFQEGDIRAPRIEGRTDGIWSSFTAAYLLDLPEILPRWRQELLEPGGWVAFTEVDGLFSHAPLEARSAQLLEAYVQDALHQCRYDFHGGGKIAPYLRSAGFTIARELSLPDREFAFEGPASEEVLEAWARRFDRMVVLQEFCGEDFARVRREFLACLAHPKHRSHCQVRFVLAFV